MKVVYLSSYVKKNNFTSRAKYKHQALIDKDLSVFSIFRNSLA